MMIYTPSGGVFEKIQSIQRVRIKNLNKENDVTFKNVLLNALSNFILESSRMFTIIYIY